MTTKTLLAGLLGLTLLGQAGAQTWVQCSNAPALNYTWVDESANGQAILAVSGGSTGLFNKSVGKVMLSTNWGTNWIAQPLPALNWSTATISTNGQYLGVAAYGGGVYVSTNWGTNWTKTAAPKANWTALAASNNGATLIGAYQSASLGAFWISTNYGTGWFSVQAPAPVRWTSLSVSADGKSQVAAYCGGAYISTNLGTNWTRTSLPTLPWTMVVANTNASQLVGVQDFGPAYRSTNFPSYLIATNWIAMTNTTSKSSSAACSDSGAYIYTASRFNGVQCTTNNGTTWTTASGLPIAGWSSVTTSPSGSNVVIVSSSLTSHNSAGKIYVGTR